MIRTVLPLVCALLVSGPAAASVLSVSSPDVTKGEWEIEAGVAWEMDGDSEKDDFREYAVEIGYSPFDFYSTGLEFSAEDEDGETDYAVTGWKNTFQFIKQGENFPLSAGLRLQYEKAHLDDEADEVAARLLFRHRGDDFDTRMNIGVEREIGSGASSDLEGDVRFSVRHLLSDELRPAIDYLGDTGSLHDLQGFENQDHRIGPVLYGSAGDVSYEAGYLKGISGDSPDHTFKLAFGVSF